MTIRQRCKALLSWLPIARFRDPPPVVSVVQLCGVIGRLGPFARGLSLAGLATTLERAFAFDDLKAVVLAVNSPGGSPTQSALIARRIRDLAAEKNVPVFAFAEDVAASGGYWLMCAADELYADASSIIGSIGVISAGFGFPELIRRWGIERRVYTAGEFKAALDPFRPERADDVEHLKQLQEDIHASFCAHVRERRRDKLRGEEADLFSGQFWTGRRAVELGLVDGLGDVRAVMRGRFGDRVKLRLVTDGRTWWRRRLGAPGLGIDRFVGDRSASNRFCTAGLDGGRAVTGAVNELLAALEERLWWARFGR